MLLFTDHINYPSLINLSNQLYSCSEKAEIYAALLRSVMGKLTAQRAMLVKHTSPGTCTALLAIGKNPFTYHILEAPIAGVDISLIEEFYQHRYSFYVTKDEEYTLFFTIMHIGKDTLVKQQAQYLELVTQISASAIRNLRNIKRLEIAEKKSKLYNHFLSSLVEVNQALITVSNIDAVVGTFYHTILGQLGITKVALFIADENNGFIVHKNSFGVDFSDDMLRRFYQFDESASKGVLGLKCELCNIIEYYIPINYNGKKHGFILLGKNFTKKNFTEQEIMFAEGLASATMGAIIKTHLVEELIEKRNIEKELEIALEIQNNLMPKSSPIIPGYAISADSIPSRQVGGDYYDIIKIKDNKYLFIIADVSGKGIPAALLMANVQAACRVLATHANDLNELLNSVNKLVYQNTPAERFVTMFACVLDTNNHTLTYSNAGHNPPLYITSNHEVKRLTEGGIILGLFDMPIDYHCGTIQLEPDSIVCLYTDGIVECPINPDRELDEEKLAEYIKVHFADSTHNIMEGIFSHISNTTGNKVNYDDQTIIIIKKN